MVDRVDRVLTGIVERRAGPLLVVLGVLMAVAHVGLVVRVVPGPLWAEATMAAFPVLVSAVVVWLGVRIDRSGTITSSSRSAFQRWFLLGVGGQLFLSTWIAIVAAFLPPYGFVPPQYAIPTAMTVAVLYGTLLGYYQAQAKHQTAALQERERDLARQNEQLETFASIVSHDLRNPLNVAQGRLQQLQGSANDETVAAIDRSLERMSALVTDLLALARTGGTVDETAVVSLSRAARRAWENVPTGDATLSVDGDASFPADPGRLAQALENLFRNSVEHGGPGVTVRVGPLEDGFFVEDDGPGVPEDDRDDVFEFGYSTDTDGTGFGLAIVEQIAAAHGWTVTLVDGTDGGARFEFAGVDVGTAVDSTPPRVEAPAR